MLFWVIIWIISLASVEQFITPIDQCKDDFICAGVHDVNNRDNEVRWFTNELDINYICKALNFYETYEPLLHILKSFCKDIVETMEDFEKDEWFY